MRSRAEFRIHVDELCGQEGILSEAISGEAGVDKNCVGKAVILGAGMEEEVVGELGGIILVGEQLDCLFEIALAAEGLDGGVFVGGGGGKCEGGGGGEAVA